VADRQSPFRMRPAATDRRCPWVDGRRAATCQSRIGKCAQTGFLSTFASAADLKSLQDPRRIRPGTSNRRHWNLGLLVPFAFRSSQTRTPHDDVNFGIRTLDHDAIEWNRIMISSLCLSMISAQTRFAFVARENRFPLFRIMLQRTFRVIASLMRSPS